MRKKCRNGSIMKKLVLGQSWLLHDSVNVEHPLQIPPYSSVVVLLLVLVLIPPPQAFVQLPVDQELH